MADWSKKYPESDHAKVLRMCLLREQAIHFEHERPCKCDQTSKSAISQKNRKLAKEAFDELDEAGCTHPEFFLIALELMEEWGATLAEMEVFFERAIKVDSRYLGTHFAILRAVLWRGGLDKSVEFANKLADRIPAGESEIFSADICGRSTGLPGNARSRWTPNCVRELASQWLHLSNR